MKSKTLHYIASLVLFIIGVTILGIHITNYRKRELYQDLATTIGTDENTIVTGKITALSTGHAFGQSRFPDDNGNIIITPSRSGNVTITSGATVQGKLVANGGVCVGSSTACISKSDIDKVNQYSSDQEPATSFRAGVNSNRCLDIKNNDTRNGNTVQMYSCNNSGAQKFKYMPSTKQIRNIGTGKCIDVAGGQGNRVHLWDCQPDNMNQKFSFNPSTNAFHWVGDRRKCLDRPGGSTVDGAEIRMWECNATEAQTWY